MGNLLFSPSGRIGSAAFMKGVGILVALGLILGLIPIFVPALGILGLVGLVLIWCWIVLWVKRYHDGGKSGWMCLIPIIVWFVVAMIVGFVFASMFADPAVVEATAQALVDGDYGTYFQLSMSGGLTQMGQIISAVVGAVISYVVALIFNGMIKHEDHDNRFGPETSAADTFS